jgi:thiol-disulfide isomerase/thioredoxin
MSTIVKSAKKPSTITTIKNESHAKKFVKDVNTDSCIILYYWNSCGHCHSFMPIWDQIKERFNTQKKIYEVEYNDMNTLFPQNLKMFSYPSIVSYNQSKPINFVGHSRTFDNVSDFINKYVKTITTPTTASRQTTRLATTPKPTPKPTTTATPKPRATPKKTK